MSVQLLFEPRDLWLGVYWDRRPFALVIYLCLLPMLPLRLIIPRLPLKPWYRTVGVEESLHRVEVEGICAECGDRYRWVAEGEQNREGTWEPIYPDQFCERCRYALGYY